MKFEIPGLIRVGSAHRLFSGTVLDLTSRQYTGYEGGAVSISTVEESYEGTRDNCLGRASTDLKLQCTICILRCSTPSSKVNLYDLNPGFSGWCVCLHAGMPVRTTARARRVCVRLNVHTPLELAMCVHLNLHTCVHIRFLFKKESWLVYMYLRAYTRIYIYIYRTSIKIKIKLVFAPDFDGLKINQYGAY